MQSHTASLKWHRHSCLPRGTKGLCSDDHPPTTSTQHSRPHFTSTSTQPDPRLQSNLQALRSPDVNPGQRYEPRLKWHRHSCLPRGTNGLCSDEHQPTTSTHHPRPHFTSTSTQPDPRLQSNLQALRSPNSNLAQSNEQRLKWHRHSCLCSDERHRSTKHCHHRPSDSSNARAANDRTTTCSKYRSQ